MNKIRLIELVYMLDKQRRYNLLPSNNGEAYYNLAYMDLVEIAKSKMDLKVLSVNPITNSIEVAGDLQCSM